MSPDLGDRNVFYLRQISQQLAGFADSDLSARNNALVPLQDYSPRPLTITIVRVNAVWVLSLVFSIMSGHFATLNQQWARRYPQPPHITSSASEQARVRSFIFFGTNKYGIITAMELTPMLLRFSILLFFAGRIVFFLIVYKTIAIVLSVSLSGFALVYLAWTILRFRQCQTPNPAHRCRCILALSSASTSPAQRRTTSRARHSKCPTWSRSHGARAQHDFPQETTS